MIRIADDTIVNLEVRLLPPGAPERTCFVACTFGNFRSGDFVAETVKFLETKADPQ